MRLVAKEASAGTQGTPEAMGVAAMDPAKGAVSEIPARGAEMRGEMLMLVEE